MKPLSIVIIIASIICLCLLFPYHQMFYDPIPMLLLCLWLISVIMFIVLHEDGTPWPFENYIRGKYYGWKYCIRRKYYEWKYKRNVHGER